MAPGLPIHRSTFFAGGNISPALPTNLLRIDGLKRTCGEFCCFLFFWRHVGNFVASCSFGGTWEICCFLFFWRHLGDSFASWSFGGTFWETIFLVEGYLLFVFLSFSSYWLIVTWCIDLLLHPLPSALLGLFVHLPFFFHFMATPRIVGGCWYIAIDTLSTLGSLFSSIPPYLIVRDSGTWGDWHHVYFEIMSINADIV